MCSSYFPAHPLLVSQRQVLVCDTEQGCIMLLDEQKTIQEQVAMSSEEVAFFADLLIAYPYPVEIEPDHSPLDIPTWNSRLHVLHLRLEAVASGYRLALCPSDTAPGSPLHPRVYMQLHWYRGMLTIPPFLL